MPVQAKAQFHDPSEIPVTIVLTAPLRDFEQLSKELAPAPFWVVRNLADQIRDVSWKLRRQVEGPVPAPRRMREWDIYPRPEDAQ